MCRIASRFHCDRPQGIAFSRFTLNVKFLHSPMKMWQIWWNTKRGIVLASFWQFYENCLEIICSRSEIHSRTFCENREWIFTFKESSTEKNHRQPTEFSYPYLHSRLSYFEFFTRWKTIFEPTKSLVTRLNYATFISVQLFHVVPDGLNLNLLHLHLWRQRKAAVEKFFSPKKILREIPQICARVLWIVCTLRPLLHDPTWT